ncbi:hypothetical protein F5Y19DRAFT_485519, partial [Xylariaceae sp. FL1651]
TILTSISQNTSTTASLHTLFCHELRILVGLLIYVLFFPLTTSSRHSLHRKPTSISVTMAPNLRRRNNNNYNNDDGDAEELPGRFSGANMADIEDEHDYSRDGPAITRQLEDDIKTILSHAAHLSVIASDTGQTNTTVDRTNTTVDRTNTTVDRTNTTVDRTNTTVELINTTLGRTNTTIDRIDKRVKDSVDRLARMNCAFSHAKDASERQDATLSDIKDITERHDADLGPAYSTIRSQWAMLVVVVLLLALVAHLLSKVLMELQYMRNFLQG